MRLEQIFLTLLILQSCTIAPTYNNNWNNNIDEGFIKRSRFNDHRNDENNINYSSLIIEAVLKNSN